MHLPAILRSRPRARSQNTLRTPALIPSSPRAEELAAWLSRVPTKPTPIRRNAWPPAAASYGPTSAGAGGKCPLPRAFSRSSWVSAWSPSSSMGIWPAL